VAADSTAALLFWLGGAFLMWAALGIVLWLIIERRRDEDV
jgi:hypothetical protein